MTRARRLHLLALAAVTGLALALRLVGLDWDQGHHLHPDERFLSIVLTQIRPPTDLALYFDPARSPYNPFNQRIDFFVYGTFPLFLVDGLSSLLGLQGYDQAYLVGRALSAIADTGTVLLVYLLGRRLLGAWPGLLAALLMALSVHAIQLSHFFTVDTFATFFSTAALWLAGASGSQAALARPWPPRAGDRAGAGEQAERRAAGSPGSGLVGGGGLARSAFADWLVGSGFLAGSGRPGRLRRGNRISSRSALCLCVCFPAGLAAWGAVPQRRGPAAGDSDRELRLAAGRAVGRHRALRVPA